METEYQSEAEPINETPYIALTGEQWCVFYEYIGDIWPR